MPLPRALGRFNRRVTNRILGPVVGRLPGFGYVVHVGRRTGREYRTPVLAFRSGDLLTIALTYGPQADWVRNVVAAGGAQFRAGGRTLQLTAPRVRHDPRRRSVPGVVAAALRLLRTSDFLDLTPIPARSRTST